MALKNKLFIAAILFTNVAEAKIILPELLAKQAIDNIRFLSNEGKFTYYQKRSGSLLYSSSYKVYEIIKGETGTQYTLYGTPARKKILISKNENFHNFYSLRAKEKLYLVDYGETNVTELGNGIAPVLHNNDSWVSFYDPYTKVISFMNTTNSALAFSIKLNNRTNPYFVPQVTMTDDNTIYYTDLGENGFYGLLEYKRSNSKSDLIYKASTPMEKIEICSSNDQLYLGVFGIHSGKNGSSIDKISLPITDFKKKDNLYKSESNDLGHLLCNYEKGKVAFIKNFGTNSAPVFDIAEIAVETKALKPLSEMKNISNVINMDGTLLTVEKGKYYIVKGDADYKNADMLKARLEPAAGKGTEKADE